MGNGEECYRRYLDGDSAAFGDILCIYRDGLTFFIDGYVHDIIRSRGYCNGYISVSADAPRQV